MELLIVLTPRLLPACDGGGSNGSRNMPREREPQLSYVRDAELANRQAYLDRALKFRDSCEKLIVVRQGRYEPDIGGINILSAKDFFLGSLPRWRGRS